MNHDLKVLQLRAKREVYTLLSGNNLSKLHGEGYDFSELSEYQMGDDIRKINWVVSAKLGKPYIKQFHANRELSVVVCTLMDGSLYFGEGNAKQHKITEIATILGYASQQSGDLFLGIGYQAKNIYVTPPTKQIYHINEFSKKLYDAPLLGSSLDYSFVMGDLFNRVSKSSLLFVIGDFLEEIDLSLLAQRHEVIAIVVRDREEESPQNLGEVVLSSPRTHSKIDTYFGSSSIKKYLSKLDQHDRQNRKHFMRYGVRFIKIFTDEDVVSKLLTLF